jgi:ureidoglycolate hydrolase
VEPTALKKRIIQNINSDNFGKYGTVIEFTPGYREDFEIRVRQNDGGWRLAVFRVPNRTAQLMENHPNTKESFEPLQGTVLLIVAENSYPGQFEAFLLDKPVCLHEGVWHQVLALSVEAQVKIVENLEVRTEFHYFERDIEPIII